MGRPLVVLRPSQYLEPDVDWIIIFVLATLRIPVHHVHPSLRLQSNGIEILRKSQGDDCNVNLNFVLILSVTQLLSTCWWTINCFSFIPRSFLLDEVITSCFHLPSKSGIIILYFEKFFFSGTITTWRSSPKKLLFLGS